MPASMRPQNSTGFWSREVAGVDGQIKEDQSAPRKPCHLQHASIPTSKGRATRTMSGPDKLGGPGSVADFPNPPKTARHLARRGQDVCQSQLRCPLCAFSKHIAREVPVSRHILLFPLKINMLFTYSQSTH